MGGSDILRNAEADTHDNDTHSNYGWNCREARNPLHGTCTSLFGMSVESVEPVLTPYSSHHWRYAISLSTSAGIIPRLLTLTLFGAATAFSQVVPDKEAVLNIWRR
ncbi:MAG: hypothetical protein MZU97_07180 [Bacillus subtilis]|nr:hypothetical protein [Bacillus subtilis]